MHVALDTVHKRTHEKTDRLRTEGERKEREKNRRENAIRRFSSLAAQLLVPLCPLFSLPGLTEKWYITKNAAGDVVEARPDPPLIVAAGAVTLSVALLANVAILFRLIDTHTRWFSFSTVVLLIIHIVVNLIALIIFGVEHAHPDGYILSTAFWLTAASSCIAFAAIVCLVGDGFLTKWYARGGTGISGKQRSLVLTWDFFVLLILIGAVAFRYLIANATYLDSIYFCIQTALTVGFGDVAPESAGGYVVVVIWSTLGILTFALLVTFTRATALEAVQEQYQSQERLILERLRRRLPARAAPSPGLGSLIIALLSFGLIHSRQRQQADEEAEENTSVGGDDLEDVKATGQYEHAIEELRAEKNREFRSQLTVSLSLFLIFWLVGAAVFSKIEGWSFGVGVYFVFVMASTIGYGDYSPQTQAGRAFFCVWALLGVAILTVLFSVLSDAYSERFKEIFQRSILKRGFFKLFGTERTKSAEQEAVNAVPCGGRDSASESSLALPRADTRATRDSEGTAVDHAADPKTHPGDDALVDFLRDIRHHLDELIFADDEVKDKHVDRVSRRVMDREKFSRENRERVETSQAFKEFLYLRHLRDKLARLEAVMADQLVQTHDDEAVGGVQYADKGRQPQGGQEGVRAD